MSFADSAFLKILLVLGVLAGLIGFAEQFSDFYTYTFAAKPAQAYPTRNTPAALKALAATQGVAYGGYDGVSLRYKTQAGQTLDVMRFVSPSQRAVLASGKPLDILYDTAEPREFVFADKELPSGVGRLSISLVCCALLWLWHRRQKHRLNTPSAATIEQAETVIAGATVVGWFLRLATLGLSVAMCWAAVHAWQEDSAFTAKGLKALVQPVEVYKAVTTVTKRFIIVETNRSTSFSADIAFETASKRVVKMNRSLPEAVVERIRGGQPVWIQYLSDDPTHTRFDGEHTKWWVFLGIGLIASAITVLVWRITKVARRA
jgi:hypothetical protein